MVDDLRVITKMEIRTAPEDWFIVKVYNNQPESIEKPNSYWIFYPCRNEQNWYYSDDLLLNVTIWDTKKTLDLQELWCVKDEIFD
jgi:hypothetical protein